MNAEQKERLVRQNEKTRRIRSVFEYNRSDDGEADYYHLYQELVEHDVEQNAYHCLLCPSCVHAIQSDKLPKFSIAKGYDFGVLSRFLSDRTGFLSLVEKVCIAKHRIHIDNIKNQVIPKLIKGFVGQAIDLPHDAPNASLNTITNIADQRARELDSNGAITTATRVLPSLQVVFIGPPFLHYQLERSGLIQRNLMVEPLVMAEVLGSNGGLLKQK